MGEVPLRSHGPAALSELIFSLIACGSRHNCQDRAHAGRFTFDDLAA
jgi:hypothetical protein